MPLMHFKCKCCKKEIEIFLTFAEFDDKRPTCCNSQMISVMGCLHTSVKGEPTTIGQLCDKNSAQLGKYGLEEKQEIAKQEKEQAKKALYEKAGIEKKPDPWYKADAETTKKINEMTPQRKIKYIMEGE